METSRLYGGNGAALPYNQIVAPMWFERLYGGIGEKSIDFSPTAPYKRSASSHPPLSFMDEWCMRWGASWGRNAVNWVTLAQR